MKKKSNAQDEFEKLEPYGGKTTFLEAYPEVASLDLEVRASAKGPGNSSVFSYSLANPPSQFFPCPNTKCSGGGFEIGTFLFRTIRKRATTEMQTGHCVGSERYGRGKSSPCYYDFVVTVNLTYKEENEEAEQAATQRRG